VAKKSKRTSIVKKALRGLFCFSQLEKTQHARHKAVNKDSFMKKIPMLKRALITTTLLLLSGCEIPGLGPDPRIAKKEADAKAIGSACRHGLRGIEDCYRQNEDISKSDIFTGWKDMDLYMRENKIEGVPAPAAKPAPIEEIIEPAKTKDDAKADKKVDPKAKTSPESKEKPGSAKPPASDKTGAKTPPSGPHAAPDKSPASATPKVPAAVPAKSAAKEAAAGH
jgi:hypothetical protein